MSIWKENDISRRQVFFTTRGWRKCVRNSNFGTIYRVKTLLTSHDEMTLSHIEDCIKHANNSQSHSKNIFSHCETKP